MSVYGIPPLSEEEKEKIRNKYYAYLKALVIAEQLNLEPDYDSERYQKLIRQIALSDLHQSQRQELVKVLDNENEQ